MPGIIAIKVAGCPQLGFVEGSSSQWCVQSMYLRYAKSCIFLQLGDFFLIDNELFLLGLAAFLGEATFCGSNYSEFMLRIGSWPHILYCGVLSGV